MLAFSLVLVQPAAGLDPRLAISQYIHTSWIQSDGSLIPSIDALAQTSDGYLWLGSWQGLWRFDGLRFSRWTPPPGEWTNQLVEALAASPSGGLWIGTRRGLYSLDRGRLTDHTSRIGPGTVIVTALHQEPAGRIWMGIARGGAASVTVLEDRVIEVLAEAQVRAFSRDAGGVVWAGATGGLYSCAASSGGYHCTPGPAYPPGINPHEVRSLLHDRDGNLWIGTEGHGLFLIRRGGLERFTRHDGLSSDFVEALLEDREGNIWAGTTNGLDRFREPKVARWSTAQGLSGDLVTEVCATSGGDLWIASIGGGLDRLRDGRIQPYSSGLGAILAIFEDRARTLWIGTASGVFRLDGDRFRKSSSLGAADFNDVFAMAQDGAGTIWMADGDRLARVRQSAIEPVGIPDLKVEGIYQMVATRNGDLWLGYHKGGVAVVSGGTVHRLDGQSGLATGAVQAIFEDSSGSVWIGSTEGLSRYRNGVWTAWKEGDGLPPGGVMDVIEDRSARLWILTPLGLSPLPPELVQSPDGRATPLRLTTYGPGDGIRMRPIAGRANPRLTLAPDGRIWFGTADGLAVIDPASIRVNRVPPPVGIEDLVLDGKRIALPRSGAEVRGRSVEVEYTALSLTLPETVRFRYKLKPVNKSWVDAGATRRMAFAGLAPGRYRFLVTACNNDGEWNATGASLAFTIDPRFYQTWWFAALVIAGAGLSGLGLHRGRMRLLRSRFQLILQERTRLVRDMHDTLLQGFAGAVYQLEAASRQMSTAPEQGQIRLAKALEQADQSLREARQMLSSLRLSALENRTLAEALKSAGEQIASGASIRFEFTSHGPKRELPYDVQANLYIVAREAMSNAANHSQCDRIALELSYSAAAVSLAVRDSGKGFDPETAEQRHDHWGLAGMRQRARQIGGVLTIQSAPGCGTSVEITVKNR